MDMKFFPVFYATETETGLEFRYPNVDVIPTTDESPDGYDGALCFSAPPVFPCMVITSLSLFRRVPNRLLLNLDDLKSFKGEFFARRLWKYEVGSAGCSLAEDRAIFDRNSAARAANKKRGDEKRFGKAEA